MNQPLHLKYRPARYEDMLGQGHMMAGFIRLIGKAAQHVYLFSGPSGVGKTTLARLACADLKITPENIEELDAATYNGVDAMRDLAHTLGHRPMIGSRRRAVIIDECQRIGAAGWDVLLKTFEEAPRHAFIFLCTTDPEKIPRTIQTRATAYKLLPVPIKEITAHLRDVRDAERLKASDEVIDTIAAECGGSVRQALVWLEQCGDADEDAAAKIIGSAQKSDPVIELCRLIANPPRNEFLWDRARGLLQQLVDDGTAAESVRQTILAYFQRVALLANREQKALQAIRVLSIFDTPCPYNAKAGILIVAVAEALRLGE